MNIYLRKKLINRSNNIQFFHNKFNLNSWGSDIIKVISSIFHSDFLAILFKLRNFLIIEDLKFPTNIFFFLKPVLLGPHLYKPIILGFRNLYLGIKRNNQSKQISWGIDVVLKALCVLPKSIKHLKTEIFRN